MQVTVEVKSETLANLFVSAIESGDPVTTARKGGWCNGINTTDKLANEFRVRELGKSARFPWYANPKFFDHPGLSIEIIEVDDESTGHETKHTLKKLDIVRGLQAMAKECPSQFGMVLEGETDAPCADCFLQCVVFGELKYG
jgi:hypothetical protein